VQQSLRPSAHPMNILTGNAQSAETEGTGWFLGFSPWTILGGSDLLHVPRDRLLSGLCAKWYGHPTGHDSGNGKPLSEGRTVSILVTSESKFRIEFSALPTFPAEGLKTVVLERQGDYVAWGAGLYHRWHCVERSTILTIRWSTHEPDSWRKVGAA
jgi:hypothetical protein